MTIRRVNVLRKHATDDCFIIYER